MESDKVRSIDYSGVSGRDLRALFKKHGLDRLSPVQREGFCDQIGIDRRWFNRILYVEEKFIGLNIADRVCLGLSLDVSRIMKIIPAGYSWAAQRMAEDEFFASGRVATKMELNQRTEELKEDRELALQDAICITCNKITLDPYRFKLNYEERILCPECREKALRIVS